jgi:ribose transport system substrate-binding protein
LLYTGSVTATAANAASIAAKIYEAKELPFDWVKMSRTLHPEDWDPQNKIIPIDPSTHWGTQPGKEKLNTAYAAASWQSDLEAVTKLYADRYKSGPFL